MNSDIAAGFLTGFLMFIKISLRLGEGGLNSLDIFRGIINGAIYGAALYFSLGPLCDLLDKSYIRDGMVVEVKQLDFTGTMSRSSTRYTLFFILLFQHYLYS